MPKTSIAVRSFVSILAAGVLAAGAATAAASAATDDGASPPPGPAPSPQPYAPPAPTSPEASGHGGFMWIPCIGLHSFQGDNAKNLGPGVRLGALIGARFTDSLSGSIELTFDSLNFENLPSGAGAIGNEFSALLAPLFHLPVASAQLVLGPKIGYFHGSSNASYALGPQTIRSSASANGWVAGVHAGLFAPVAAGVSLGGLAGFEYGKTVSCTASAGSCNPAEDGSKQISLVGAALF